MNQLTVIKQGQIVFKGAFKTKKEAINKLNSLTSFYNGNCKGFLMTKK